MDSPYRSAPTTVTRAPRDSGIVGEIIGQFADRFAFYRELVQNAIDADSPNVLVTATYDERNKTVRVAVKDSGSGMPRDIIENRLLVLFRSTKENDDTKIGKFGVGFASVLAVNPQVIRVISVCDGQRLTLHLYPDLSYELFDTGRASTCGTTVEVEIPLEQGELDEFVHSSRRALARWCRHASVPIHFEVRSGAGAHIASGRIDRPLELEDAMVSVKHVSEDGAMTIVVGVTPSPKPYAGFFNYGLTLFETSEPMVGNVAFKVQDSRLGHTLSRDNVRRDGHFERALEAVRLLVRTRLRAAIAERLRAAAHNDPALYGDLVSAVVAAQIQLARDEWVFPLIGPIGGIGITSLARFHDDGAWVAHVASPLTAHMVGEGIAVVNLRGAGSISEATMAAILVELGGRRVRYADTELTLVSVIEPSKTDAALVENMRALLEATFRLPSDIALARLHGASDHRRWVAADSQSVAERFLLHGDDAERNPFFLFRRLRLVLNINEASIKSVRRSAEIDPLGAASLLCRLLLLEREKLSVDRSQELLARRLAGAFGDDE